MAWSGGKATFRGGSRHTHAHSRIIRPYATLTTDTRKSQDASTIKGCRTRVAGISASDEQRTTSDARTHAPRFLRHARRHGIGNFRSRNSIPPDGNEENLRDEKGMSSFDMELEKDEGEAVMRKGEGKGTAKN